MDLPTWAQVSLAATMLGCEARATIWSESMSTPETTPGNWRQRQVSRGSSSYQVGGRRQSTHVVDDDGDRGAVGDVTVVLHNHVRRNSLGPVARRQQQAPARARLGSRLRVLDGLGRALGADARQQRVVGDAEVGDGLPGVLDDGRALLEVEHGQLAVGAAVDEAVAARVDEVLAVLVHGVEVDALLGRVVVDGDDGRVDAGRQRLGLGGGDLCDAHGEGLGDGQRGGGTGWDGRG